MRRLLLATVALLPIAAHAQTGPHWQQDYIPGPGEWESWWEKKQDVGGAIDTNTVGGVPIGTALAGKLGVSAALDANTVNGRALAAHFTDTISVFDHGAYCDGTAHPLSGVYPSLAAAQMAYPFVTSLSDTVDWAAAQASVNAAQAVGGARVFFPHGTCMISSTVAITGNGVYVEGGGRQSVLTFTNPTADDFTIGGQASQVANDTIAHLYILGSGKTGGAAIRATKAAELAFNDLVVDQPWNGIALQQVNTVQITDANVNGHKGSCLSLYANPATGERSDGGDYRNLVCQGAFLGGDGIDVDGQVYAQRFYTVALLGDVNGLSVSNTAQSPSAFPQFLFFYGLETDGMTNASMVLNSGYRIECHNCELSNTSGGYSLPGGGTNNHDGSTVQINPDNAAFNPTTGKGGGFTRQIKFIGGRIGNTQQSAMAISAFEVSVLGVTLGDSSKAGNGLYPTVFVQNGAYDVMLNDNRIGVQYGDGHTPSTGLSVQASAARLLATNNIFAGFTSATGDISNSASSVASVHINNNLHSDGTYN